MAVALYQMIVEQLKYKIAQGEYKEYDKLPTEIELAEQYKVSRITSKKALDTLAAEGLIIRHRRSDHPPTAGGKLRGPAQRGKETRD